MKYIAIILSLMFAILETSCYAQRLTIQVDGSSIQVANKDLPYQMTWREAMNACDKLGNGWRIPNKKELEAMFEQLHQQGKIIAPGYRNGDIADRIFHQQVPPDDPGKNFSKGNIGVGIGAA